jgi:hypothetical protein
MFVPKISLNNSQAQETFGRKWVKNPYSHKAKELRRLENTYGVIPQSAKKTEQSTVQSLPRTAQTTAKYAARKIAGRYDIQI